MVAGTGTATKARGTAKKTRAKKSTTTKPRAKSAGNGTKRSMSADHKKALVEGREQSAIVDRYLKFLDTHKPKRGRKVTPDTVKARLAKFEADLLTATGVERLNLMQQIQDAEARLSDLEGAKPEENIETLQADFVRVAKSYAEKKGITRATFHNYGVPMEVLKEAGMVGRRTRRTKEQIEADTSA